MEEAMKKPYPNDFPLYQWTEDDLREYLNTIATLIEDVTPDKTLFALVLFDGTFTTQYVSNARRQGIIDALRETANRLESRTTDERTSHDGT